MKVRKLKGDWRNEAMLMCQMIVALKTARDVSTAYHDGNNVSTSGGFQCRCNDAVVALANRLMEDHVERSYEPDTKKFLVTYDVKRSGTGKLVIEAKDEAEAKARAESQLKELDDDWFDTMETGLDGVDVVEARECSPAEEIADGNA